jgi:HTH-type transcriptional regulator/antitoxin HigA
VNEIIAAKKAITTDTAREFSAALGTSPQYWMNLQTAYDLWRTVPSPNSETIARDAWLRERFPVREMIKTRWIENSESFEVLEARVFEFYGIANQNEDPRLLPHAARRNYREDMSALQEAWLFRVKNIASMFPVPKFSQKKLRDALPSLEALMTEPEEVRRVPGILAECGVRFVIVEPIPGSRIDGACLWLDDDSPVIGLSLKGDFLDRFWFNLRHEIEHVLNGDGKTKVIIDDFEAPPSEEACEIKANDAAAEFCVPQAKLRDFIVRHDPMYSTTTFIGFSRIVKRHPGIVAGQLQHKINRPELFKKFQPRVREIVAETALTDGYGREIAVDRRER